MRVKKTCYIVFAGIFAIAVILLKTCVCEKYAVCNWDCLTWIAAIGVVLAFIVCALFGCKHSAQDK